MAEEKKIQPKTENFSNKLNYKFLNLLKEADLLTKTEKIQTKVIKDIMHLLVMFKNEKVKRNEINNNDKLPLGKDFIVNLKTIFRAFLSAT